MVHHFYPLQVEGCFIYCFTLTVFLSTGCAGSSKVHLGFLAKMLFECLGHVSLISCTSCDNFSIEQLLAEHFGLVFGILAVESQVCIFDWGRSELNTMDKRLVAFVCHGCDGFRIVDNLIQNIIPIIVISFWNVTGNYVISKTQLRYRNNFGPFVSCHSGYFLLPLAMCCETGTCC